MYNKSMNQPTNNSTSQDASGGNSLSKEANLSPAVTSLGSQEDVVQSIEQIFEETPQAQPLTELISPVPSPADLASQPELNPEITQVKTVEINPNGQPISPLSTETITDNPLANSLEPVIEEEAPPLRDPASTSALHKDVQRMLREKQFPGAEQEVIHERIENTKDISLS